VLRLVIAPGPARSWLVLVAALAAACGDGSGGGADVDTSADVEVEAEVAGDTAEDADVADAVEDVETLPEITTIADTADGSGNPTDIDPDCEFDERVGNQRSTFLRCAACRRLVGGTRVRAELLWYGAYREAASAPLGCADFPDEPCRASRVEAEVLWCQNLATTSARVGWSDIVVARVGAPGAEREIEGRGPAVGALLGMVYDEAGEARLEPKDAFEAATWKVVPPEERALTVTVEAAEDPADCPVGRWGIGGEFGLVEACNDALSLTGLGR